MATAFTIWLIGYLYTLGIERRLCDEREEPLELMDAAKLLLFWPCYLGQSGVFQQPPEVNIGISESKSEDEILKAQLSEYIEIAGKGGKL